MIKLTDSKDTWYTHSQFLTEADQQKIKLADYEIFVKQDIFACLVGLASYSVNQQL